MTYKLNTWPNPFRRGVLAKLASPLVPLIARNRDVKVSG